MKCAECNYYWADEGEEYARCHCKDDMIAPCEEEDWEMEEEPELDEKD
jgi:hypothetical protein